MKRLNKKTLLLLLVAGIGFQLSVLAMQMGTALYPRLTGKEVSVRTIPVDPRSLFRGNYARLRYNFSVIEPAKIITPNNEPFHTRIGESVYVTLKPGDEGIHEFHEASSNWPEAVDDADVVLHGRVAQPRWRRGNSVRLFFGIEAYFAPKKRALALEKELRKSGIAKLRISSGGRAALMDVVAHKQQ